MSQKVKRILRPERETKPAPAATTHNDPYVEKEKKEINEFDNAIDFLHDKLRQASKYIEVEQK